MANLEDMNEDELLAWIDQQLSEKTLEQPSMRFTANLLEKWDAKKAGAKVKMPSKKSPFYFVLGMIVFSAVIVLIASFLTPGQGDNVETAIQSLTNVFSKYNLWQLLLFINATIGLIVFDRTVLKPYFQKRRLSIRS